MNIVIITSNCPRHEYLISSLAHTLREHKLHVFQEPKNKKRDYRVNYKHSKPMVEWLDEFKSIEKKVFSLTPLAEARREIITSSELRSEEFASKIKSIKPALIIVYGTGLIKQEIIDIAPKIMNLHLGMSPFYRGTATTLWPYYDKRPEMNGCTIMKLDDGIDSGDIYEIVLAEHDEKKTLNEINIDLNKKLLIDIV